MMKSLLTSEEKDEIIEAIDRGDSSIVDKLTERFTPYMIKAYSGAFSKKEVIDFEEFKHECSIDIFKNMENLKNKSFGGVCIYVNRIIDTRVALLLREFIGKKNHGISMISFVESYNSKDVNHSDKSLEDGVLDRIFSTEVYDKFIKGKIPKCQETAVRIYFSNHISVKDYVEKMNIKYESFRKNFTRGMNRIRQITATEAFRKFYYGTIVLLSILDKGTLSEEALYLCQLQERGI